HLLPALACPFHIKAPRYWAGESVRPGLVFPLDGAAEGPGLLDRWFPSGQDRVQCIPEIVGLHVGRVAIIINPSLVLEGPLRIKGENVGCADRTVLASHILGLVPEVWEVEALVLRPANHVLETILGIVVIVIAVYRNQCNTFPGIVSLQPNHPILVSLNIRAMITAENNDQRLAIPEISQTVRLGVYGLQMEVDGRAAERKSY